MKAITLIVLSGFSVYGQWISGFYGAQNGVLPVSNIPWSKYTHVIHFAAAPNSDGSIDLHYLSQAEIGQMISARPAGKKVLVCLKDNDNDYGAFAAATSPNNIGTFVKNIAAFVGGNGYDGVDLDWEANIDAGQFQDLLNRLRAAMPGKVIAMDAGNWGGLESVAAGAASSLDQVNVMCYDMDSPASGYAWYNDALLQSGNSSVMTCDWRVSAFTAAGVPAGKIGVGIPFYGRRWPGALQALDGGSFNPSTVLFRDLASDGARWQAQYQFYDSTYKANYLRIPDMGEFDSYNGVESIRDAVAWARSSGFGGFMTFTMDYEYLAGRNGDAAYPLSTALAGAVFGGAPAPSSGPTPAPGPAPAPAPAPAPQPAPAPAPAPVLVVSNGSPTGTLSAGTTEVTITVSTNLPAQCELATTAGAPFGSVFLITGGVSHTSFPIAVQPGQSYTYYAHCVDASRDITDYPITFSIGQ